MKCGKSMHEGVELQSIETCLDTVCSQCIKDQIKLKREENIFMSDKCENGAKQVKCPIDRCFNTLKKNDIKAVYDEVEINLKEKYLLR
jgi:hypothetical protein